MRSYRGKLNWKSIRTFVNLVAVEAPRCARVNVEAECIETA
jgi:hypothetical protein